MINMATNYATATYTEVIDLQTTADKISIIGIHTPVGQKAYRRMKGFFTQFRKYKYNGIKSLVMVPAAQLPVDPLGLTGVVGSSQLMDPREMLNPILFHGCHGESLSKVLDTIYTSQNDVISGNNRSNAGSDTSDSAEKFDLNISTDLYQYYSKLTDSSWRKFGIQSGVKLRKLRPLVHQVAQNMPTLPHGLSTDYADANAGLFRGITNGASGTNINTGGASSAGASDIVQGNAGVPTGEFNEVHSVTDGMFNSSLWSLGYKQQFTNRMTTLGWMPTTLSTDSTGGSGAGNLIATLPRLFMGILVMPPAYNVEQFFRMVITHSFSFREFTSTLNLMDMDVSVSSGSTADMVPYANWIDYGDTLDSLGAKSEVVSDGVS